MKPKIPQNLVIAAELLGITVLTVLTYSYIHLFIYLFDFVNNI